MASQINPRSRPSETGLRVEALLDRYPDISDREVAELVSLFPSLPILDLGLMTADDRLSEKLIAFHRDHGSKLKTPLSSLIMFLTFPAIVAIFALWWALV